MKETAIITILNISRAYEIRHFQVRIPRDTQSICAIELTVRANGKSLGKVAPVENILNYQRNPLFGDLMLFSCEEGNCFYTGELHESDNNSLMFDFSKFEKDEFAEWTHGAKQEAEEVTVDGDTTVVMGVYRDKTGKAITEIRGYEIKVIIWIKTKD
ncbi:MAG TPA: hypothetical protein DDX39_12070 [Bacteroidales bacterium]|nr:MAG: hypothetical protein A2W98_11475 [Bacteroidetes bacterium GWF2_33_38]OFY74855.1 MAG: hypothetical protein A2265_04050 [Bacteroidetes bacterium RIFOXYA12_FULL_33_9]OFY92061.1 MAG: hypothetical protein A2236_08885 [Bacteroidetes bacterium RIFOXYA2_FULL_33_7]HBF89368.1 hypothetical protein [Bacteroidales bacterium]